MSVLVALTAQNTTAVTAIHELPPEFVVAQLDAVFSDLAPDAAKTGMLFSRHADRDGRRLPRGASRAARRRPGDGRELRRDAARGRRGRRARRRGCSRSRPWSRRTCSRRSRSPAARARGASWPRGCTSWARRRSIVTGGHGAPAVDHLFDGTRARRDPGRAPRDPRHARRRLHALGHARGAARARPAARGGGARCGARRLGGGAARPRRSSARATGRSTSST